MPIIVPLRLSRPGRCGGSVMGRGSVMDSVKLDRPVQFAKEQVPSNKPVRAQSPNESSALPIAKTRRLR